MLPHETAAFRLVERAGAPVIVRGGELAPTVATVPPYRPEAERAARDLIARANRCRRVEGALRLLYATAHAFVRRPRPQTWRDLSAAVGVAREALTEHQ